MIQKIFLLAFGISFLSLACAESPPAGVAPVAIRAGGLIDVQGGRVLRNQVILIRGAKIEAVGPRPSRYPPTQSLSISPT